MWKNTHRRRNASAKLLGIAGHDHKRARGIGGTLHATLQFDSASENRGWCPLRLRNLGNGEAALIHLAQQVIGAGRGALSIRRSRPPSCTGDISPIPSDFAMCVASCARCNLPGCASATSVYAHRTGTADVYLQIISNTQRFYGSGSDRCGMPVLARAYQAKSVLSCSPVQLAKSSGVLSSSVAIRRQQRGLG